MRILFTALLSLFFIQTSGATADVPFTWHDKGFVPFQASRIDPRFPYMLYVPEDYDEEAEQEYPLVVLVHGTERWPHEYLRYNSEFAEENDVILLAPLFPIGTHGQFDLENYKLLDYKGTRYDLILLSMVDEVTSKYRIQGNKFNLFGFSGGGHFTHRFFYLHPHRLNAISIGAPGMVTMINDEADWWVGTRDVYWRFNARKNLKRMSEVKVHMVIGEEDTGFWEKEIEKGSPYNMGPDVPEANYHAGGRNRQDKMRSLKTNYEDNGIAVEMEIVPDAGHDETKMFEYMQRFFQKHLR